MSLAFLLLLCLAANTFAQSVYYNRTRWASGTYYCGYSTQGMAYEKEQVIFSFYSYENQTVTVSTCGSDYDTYLTIYESYYKNTSRVIDYCDDCGYCGSQTVLSFEAKAWTYYVVGLQGYSGQGGAYSISFNCTSDDTTSYATTSYPWWTTPSPITTPDVYDCGDVISGSLAPNEIQYFGFMNYENKSVVASTCGSYFDTVVSVKVWWLDDYYPYRSCDDCGSCAPNEELFFYAPSGYFFIIGVSGYFGDYGQFDLELKCVNRSDYTTTPWWNFETSTTPYTPMMTSTMTAMENTMSTMSTMSGEMTTSTMANGSSPDTTESDPDNQDGVASISIKFALIMVIVAYFAG